MTNRVNLVDTLQEIRGKKGIKICLDNDDWYIDYDDEALVRGLTETEEEFQQREEALAELVEDINSNQFYLDQSQYLGNYDRDVYGGDLLMAMAYILGIKIDGV